MLSSHYPASAKQVEPGLSVQSHRIAVGDAVKLTQGRKINHVSVTAVLPPRRNLKKNLKFKH